MQGQAIKKGMQTLRLNVDIQARGEYLSLDKTHQQPLAHRPQTSVGVFGHMTQRRFADEAEPNLHLQPSLFVEGQRFSQHRQRVFPRRFGRNTSDPPGGPFHNEVEAKFHQRLLGGKRAAQRSRRQPRFSSNISNGQRADTASIEHPPGSFRYFNFAGVRVNSLRHLPNVHNRANLFLAQL